MSSIREISVVKENTQKLQLQSVSTEELILELEKRANVKKFESGIYAKYDVQIKRKYASRKERGFVEMPDNSIVLVIERF